MCNYKDCKTQPIFNFENEQKAKFCFKHKLDGMIDVKNKKCIYKDCTDINRNANEGFSLFSEVYEGKYKTTNL